jgi:ATP-dependent RNA helicase DeaD
MSEQEHADAAPENESSTPSGVSPQANTQIDPNTTDAAGNKVFSEVTFADLGLRNSVLKGLDAAGFKHPTPIQAQLIPRILLGKDVLGQAKTGTGKTAAFGLPLLHACEKDVPQQALILAPTRELAVQIAKELDDLGRSTPIRTSSIIGGESMRQQARELEDGAHIVVGTPGRVMDLHGRGQLSFRNIRYVCLDEVDRMLDIGFRDDIRKILSDIPNPDRQTIFVSATVDEAIERLARSFMKKDAEKVNVVAGSLTVSQVDQKHLPVEPWDKRALLLKLLKTEKPDTTLVFCRTKHTVRKTTEYLRDKGLSVKEIHGDLDQRKRTKVMQSLRDQQVDVVIASDLAARGLDVDHITHVINYDLPEDPEIYIHRIGRTARAGRRGQAWSFVTPEQGQLLTEIEKLVGAMIEKMEFPDFVPGEPPADIREQRHADRKRVEKAKAPPADRSRGNPVDEFAHLSDEEKAKMFPGGIVPKSAPRRTLGSRLRTKRKR